MSVPFGADCGDARSDSKYVTVVQSDCDKALTSRRVRALYIILITDAVEAPVRPIELSNGNNCNHRTT